MTRERVVIDTNVLISSLFLATSTPAQAVDKAVTKAQLVALSAKIAETLVPPEISTQGEEVSGR
jgi:predicted nucleic acid-binding protein